MYHDDGEHSSLNLIHLIHSTKSLRCLSLLNSLCLLVFVCWLQVVFVQKGEICHRVVPGTAAGGEVEEKER